MIHVISSLMVSVLSSSNSIVVYCPTRHSHSSSLIHVLALSNLIVVCISLRSPPLRRCPSSLPRIWSSCNIILVIHLCLDDNLSRLIKLDSRVYFLIHLCPWWYHHLLINDVRPLPLEFDCRVYLTGHSFPLRWYMSSLLTSSNLNMCISPHSPPPRLASLSRHTINFGDEREDTMVEQTSLMTKMSAVGPRVTADMTTPDATWTDSWFVVLWVDIIDRMCLCRSMDTFHRLYDWFRRLK